MPELDPQQQRQLALDVVRRLRAAGFVAYWAGGCVRDQLVGRTPKDYDVATDATPDQIRQLFGRRHTLAIGVAFGVITVRGSRAAGHVEVTTFRRDAAYSDGRHPDAVIFTSAEEDASRRDFTVNGLFYDPLTEQVIDYVGGQRDLADRLIRAIGQPRERFAEDKLRMLRAVRFAAAFDFRMDDDTRASIVAMADQITVVSPERIAMEMRRTLIAPGRALGLRLLLDTGLAAQVLPEMLVDESRLARGLSVLQTLAEPSFALALGTLLAVFERSTADVATLADRWRLSNAERERITWLVENHDALAGASQQAWSQVQPLLVHAGAAELIELHAARWQIAGAGMADVDWCRLALARPAAELNPPPLVTGDDLLWHGVPAGPAYRRLLAQVRDAQLDGLIHSREEALALVERLRKGDAH